MARELRLMLAAALLAACGGGAADAGTTATDPSIDEPATPAAAQAATDTVAAPVAIAFDTAAARGERPLLREVYRWDAAPRDPFRPVFVLEGSGPELPDLVLSSVIHDPNVASKSIATFSDRGSSKRYVVGLGERIGRLTVVEITGESVTLRMNDFGTIRDQTYHVRRSEDGTP